MPPTIAKKVVLKNAVEKNTFYAWIWLTGAKMRNEASRPTSVDAALYRKFKKMSIENARRNAFLGSVED